MKNFICDCTATVVAFMLMAVALPTAFRTNAQTLYVDVNCDGKSTVEDVTDLIDYLLSGRTDGIVGPFSSRLGYLSARDYGAVGDGVADDTPALERLFADAAAMGKAVYIPEGVYMICRPLTIKSGMEVYGDGDNSIIRKIPAAWHMLTDEVKTGVYNDDEDHTITVKVDGIDGYHVGDHCFITYSTNPFNPANARARYCSYGEIAAINETPIEEDGVTKYEVKFKSAYDSEKHGVVYRHQAGTFLSTSFPLLRSWSFKDECVNVYIHDICLDGNRQTNGPKYNNVTYEPMEWANGCIHFDAYAAAKTNGISYNNHSYNHIVERCRLINASYDGLSDQGEGGLIVNNCVIENNAMHGVHMGTIFANALIYNNTMTGNGTRGAGVFYCQAVSNLIVDGNTITRFNHGCSDEEYASAGKFSIIRNNTFNNITSYVFDFLKATSTARGGGLLITGNTITGLKNSLFSGNYLDDVILTNNQVTSVSSSTIATLVKATHSNQVIVVGNTLPDGANVAKDLDDTDCQNVIHAQNSWN